MTFSVIFVQESDRNNYCDYFCGINNLIASKPEDKMICHE
jgi:hypothetical protein